MAAVASSRALKGPTKKALGKRTRQHHHHVYVVELADQVWNDAGPPTPAPIAQRAEGARRLTESDWTRAASISAS